MTIQPAQFPFVDTDPAARSGAGIRPYLPISLTRGDKSVSVNALLDTGATTSVLPYDVGLQLGAVWDEQTVPLELSGNLANIEARGLVASGSVGPFPAVNLVFAWAKSNAVPVLLGQMNFFMEFDVCFFRARLLVEVRPK